MESVGQFQIITFYEFREFDPDHLERLKTLLAERMKAVGIKGTIILATEGINASICAVPSAIETFVLEVEGALESPLTFKSSFHDVSPFQKVDVKIKPEIVTLKKRVDISLGEGTHVDAKTWNEIISDPSVVVLDTRNDYEFRSGTFRRAINPQTEKFSDLPVYVAENLDPETHPKIAMFCTGGIRCEKFAPYMKQMGFKEVFQLDGGILRYLEKTATEESLWEGECFVFDDRVSIDHELRQGNNPDHSLGKNKRRSK